MLNLNSWFPLVLVLMFSNFSPFLAQAIERKDALAHNSKILTGFMESLKASQTELGLRAQKAVVRYKADPQPHGISSGDYRMEIADEIMKFARAEGLSTAAAVCPKDSTYLVQPTDPATPTRFYEYDAVGSCVDAAGKVVRSQPEQITLIQIAINLTYPLHDPEGKLPDAYGQMSIIALTLDNTQNNPTSYKSFYNVLTGEISHLEK